MKKKAVLLIAAAALIGTLAVGGTLAWFTDTETATNVVTTGNVDIAWFENGKKITTKNPGVNFGSEDGQTPVVPGESLTKEAWVQNEGKNDAYIRAKILFFEGTDRKAIDQPEYLTILGTDDKWVKDQDGYYYYDGILSTNADTEPIMTSVKIDGSKAKNDNFADKEFTIELVAEAIQSDHLGAEINSSKKAFTEAGNGNIVSYDTETEAESESEQAAP